MVNPKCGSCRFFQEADLPGSGWCHHPQRKVSSDVKILVRRNELACRDEWSRSLWQPASGPDAADELSFFRGASAGPVQPTSRENLHALLSRDAMPIAPDGEDVLLSEGRILSENHEPWEPEARPFPAGNFDPRTAIFRAREAYRERVRARAALARQAAGAEASPVYPIPDDAGTHAAEQTAKISMNDSDERPALGADVTANQTGAPFDDDDLAAAEFAMQDFTALHRPSDAAEASHRSELGDPNEITPAGDELGGEANEFSVTSEEDVREVAEPEVEFRPGHHADETSDSPELPEWFRTDLPHTCRTCRDFRPAAEGQRGWCGNRWAFTHRQLVQEDDISPCHSTTGDWWVPVDDVWLVAADVSSHGRATPLLDRLIPDDAARRRRF